MVRTVVGLFEDSPTAQAVVEDLVNAGFMRDRISFLARHEADRPVTDQADLAGSMVTGMEAGAAFGGLGGLLLGLVTLAIPGVGTVLVAGPIAAAVGGATLGAAVGGVIGSLRDLGVPENEAPLYAEGIRRGHVLVAVPVNADDAARAEQIMARHDAVDLTRHAAEWASTSVTSADVAAAGWTTDDVRRERDTRAREMAAESRPSASGVAGVGADAYPADVDRAFRAHWERTLARPGRTYEADSPAYRFGYELARNPRYATRDWTVLAPEAHRQCEERRLGNWAELEPAVRYAWEMARRKRAA